MKRFLIACVILIPLTGSAQWTLDSCIQYAFQNNISIKQNALNLEISEVNELTSLGNMLPSLNAQATHGYNWGQRIDPFTNQFATERIRSNNFGISTGLTLFNGFALVNTWKQASLNSETNKWTLEKMRNDIALNVATSYLTILLNKEFLEIARRNRDATQRQVLRLNKLFNAGQLAQSGVADMEAQLANDNANVVTAENNYNLAVISLMQLLQLDPARAADFSIATPSLDELNTEYVITSPEIIVQAALNNLPEVKSAETSLASSDLGVKIAKGSQLPSLTMNYSYGSGYSGASKVLTGTPELRIDTIGITNISNEYVLAPGFYFGNDSYTLKPFNDQLKDNVNQSLFFSLNIPIFNGFNTRSNIKRAKLNREISELQLQQTKQTVEQNVYRAHADAQAALAQYNASALSVTASEKAFGYAESRYENGQSNAVDFADAQTRLQNALATLTRSKYEYIFKLKILEFYQGKTINLK